MRVVGYVNRLSEYPAPLVTIAVQKGGRFFAIYPSGEVMRILDVTRVEDFSCNSDAFISAANNLVVEDPTNIITFAFSRDHIVTSDRRGIFRALKEEAEIRPDLSPDDLLIYYLKELQSKRGIDIATLSRTLGNRKDISLELYYRGYKSKNQRQHGSVRMRPVLRIKQVCKHQTRTLYSRGLAADIQNPISMALPKRIVGYFSALAVA